MKNAFLLLMVFASVFMVSSCHDEITKDDPAPVNLDTMSKVITIEFNGQVIVTNSLKEAISIVTSYEYVRYAEKMKKGSTYASVDCSIISCQATSGFCLVECCYSSGGVSYHIMEV